MHYYVLLLFALSFSMGIYLILAHLLKNFYLSSQESHFICGKTKKKAKIRMQLSWNWL